MDDHDSVLKQPWWRSPPFSLWVQSYYLRKCDWGIRYTLNTIIWKAEYLLRQWPWIRRVRKPPADGEFWIPFLGVDLLRGAPGKCTGTPMIFMGKTTLKRSKLSFKTKPFAISIVSLWSIDPCFDVIWFQNKHHQYWMIHHHVITISIVILPDYFASTCFYPIDRNGFVQESIYATK